MRLDGEKGPWGFIECCGIFDNGEIGYEPIIRPVDLVPGHDCSPRKVSPEAVVALGYVVEDSPAESDEWATDPAELGTPFDGDSE